MALSFPRDWPERAPILEVFAAALDAVDPEHAVRSALEHERLESDLTVVAIGKAAAAMARGVPGPAAGIVVSDHAEPIPVGFTSHLGEHPIPGEQSLAAGEAVVALIEATTGPLLFLISGGSSALCELPAPGLTIADVASVNAALLRSGADITAMNTVRKHLSSIKGGRLAQRATGRAARSLVVSDVVGDSIDTIGSGPTVPDPTTYADATKVLEDYRVDVPESVRSLLRAGLRGDRDETPKQPIASHDVQIVANAEVAARAAVESAQRQSIPAWIETTELSGGAQVVAAELVAGAGDEGMAFYAGETTVEVTGGGVGGRNQHAALAAALILDGGDGNTMFGTLATDGVDGPTDAAGAVVDGETVARGREAGLKALDYFDNHASHPFLEASGDMLRIGPSGTNVGDLWVVWRR